MSITHEENQAIIDNMYKRLREENPGQLAAYMNGTPEEIAAVERHRAASPWKIGHEPPKPRYYHHVRFPRKLKAKLKKQYKVDAKEVSEILNRIGAQKFSVSLDPMRRSHKFLIMDATVKWFRRIESGEGQTELDLSTLDL